MSTPTSRPGTGQIDAAALRDARGSDAPPTLLDVRSPAEFESAHIPGAHNVPVDVLRDRGDEVARALTGPTVLICQAGPRAEQAERVLAGAGVTEARVLSGGMNAWLAAGGDVVRGRQVWALERQVRFTAGTLVLIGLLSSLLVPGLQWFSAAIGAGLVFSAVSNTCAMGNVLSRMPWNRGTTYDPDAALAGLGR